MCPMPQENTYLWEQKMRVVGLLPLSVDDYDILPRTLESISWLDLIVIKPSDVPYDDVNQKALMAHDYDADWFVNLDADEVYSAPIDFSKVPDECNVVTVDIYSELSGRVYDIKKNWKRAFRNQAFDFSVLAPLHKSRIPIGEQTAWDSGVKIHHHSIRSYEQGMKKYERYKRFDTAGQQVTYEHIRRLAECLRSKDYSGVQWVS